MLRYCAGFNRLPQKRTTVDAVVGIDASRNRSGGAKAHLVGILSGSDPMAHGIREVHLWAYKSLIDAVPDFPWLVKHSPSVLEKSLICQVWWQYWHLPRKIRECGCNILFNTDAGSVCPFQPAVTLSQDMLSYEPGEMKRFGLSRARLRLLLLRHIQSRSLKKARGALFLTNYAASMIQKTIGILQRSIVIPHGIGDEFRLSLSERMWPPDPQSRIRCLYVSHAELYKHQWNVVRAVAQVRQAGYDASLVLAGGGRGLAQRLLEKSILANDPKREFVEQREFVNHNKIPELLADADVFVFASSCENMPITLLEAMASGLPIACANRGPMPEVLDDGGVYFDPENVESIAIAIKTLFVDSILRERNRNRAREISDRYSWTRCSTETWRFLSDCAIIDQENK